MSNLKKINCAAKKVNACRWHRKKNTIIRGSECIYTATEDFKRNKKSFLQLQ